MTDAQEPRIRSYDRHGEPYDDVVRDAAGRAMTEEDMAALAAEAEGGYWCREPIGGGRTCNRLGRPIPRPPTPDRIVLCEQHRKGWGREL